jgi:hypothetical protein
MIATRPFITLGTVGGDQSREMRRDRYKGRLTEWTLVLLASTQTQGFEAFVGFYVQERNPPYTMTYPDTVPDDKQASLR